MITFEHVTWRINDIFFNVHLIHTRVKQIKYRLPNKLGTLCMYLLRTSKERDELSTSHWLWNKIRKHKFREMIRNKIKNLISNQQHKQETMHKQTRHHTSDASHEERRERDVRW